jgi:hypothetical protein
MKIDYNPYYFGPVWGGGVMADRDGIITFCDFLNESYLSKIKQLARQVKQKPGSVVE